MKNITLLVGTRKGAFLLRADDMRSKWTLTGPQMLGQIVHHLVLDPRDGRTLLMAAKTGHLGPTIFRSTDAGATWKEAKRPPAFPKSKKKRAPAVDHTFWLTPGHASQPGAWYAGTSPQGLFRSEDGGVTWDGVKGFNAHRMWAKWSGFPSDPNATTPDGPKMHSILVDPRAAAHLYLSMSGGGTFESTDAGKNWKPLNEGVEADFMPMKNPEYGHDPHRVALHPLQPDRLYQQNHCGIYRLDRPSDRWERIGRNMPKEIGDIGFGVALHARDPKTVWVFPMDGTQVWPRVSHGGRPAVYRSRDEGRTWERQDRGLPREQAWFTVKRQAFTADALDPVGLYFGTTSGEIWASRNEGDEWTPIAAHLPHIYSIEVACFQ